MQIVSIGDNMHEMSKPVFWEKSEKYFKMSAEFFSQSVKSYVYANRLYLYSQAQLAYYN